MVKAKNPKAPAGFVNYPLGIKRTVYGREKKSSGRVTYIVDPEGLDPEKKISEVVVLKRWRKRSLAHYSFSGTTLNPKIWRSLPTVFGNDSKRLATLTVKEIAEYLQSSRIKYPEVKKFLPSASILAVMFKVCGAERLQNIIKRHNDPSRTEIFGTPDLFLFATNSKTKEIHEAHFVEVKRPDEKLSDWQEDEISFLKSLGLQAGVYRLKEKN
jgi:hypothetical protein